MKGFFKIVILILSITFTSCKDNKKISELNKLIEEINPKISETEKRISTEKYTIDSLKSDKEKQFALCSEIKDSADLYISSNRKAAAYIYEFDKDPKKFI